MSDLTLEDRVRIALSDDPNISEKRMFGAACFMLNGNLLCGVDKSNTDLMLRVGKEQEPEVRKKPHTRDMDFSGKPLRGYLYVGGEGIDTDKKLQEWLAIGINFVGNLPPK